MSIEILKLYNGDKEYSNLFVSLSPFFILKEVFIIKSTIAFDTLNEVYEYYNDNVLKITNLKQIIFYSNIFSVLPDWIGESPYDGKLIAYYGKERTKECWEKWKRTSVSNMEKDLV